MHLSVEEVLDLRKCGSCPLIPRASWWGSAVIMAFALATVYSLGTCMEKKGQPGMERGRNMNDQSFCYTGDDGRISLPFSLTGKELCSVRNGL